jgi:phosphonate ABC transporter permease subunit PhnE
LPRRDQKAAVAALLSLIVPGLGQFRLKHRWRGVLIFTATLLLAFIINWALSNFKIGQVTIGGATSTWLWFLLMLFWAWNVLDARRLALGRPARSVAGVLAAAVILYVIAWNVTDVKLDRLVTRFDDAKKVAADLVHPDILWLEIPGQEGQICAVECLMDRAWTKLTGGEVQGALRISDNFRDIIGQVKQGPPPAWLVRLRLVSQEANFPRFVAGKLIETIAIGLLATVFSTLLAIPLSFLAAHNIMSRAPGGNAIYYAMRTFLNVVRAVDTVIWGLIVIVWVGLGTFAGVIALTIHSVAALGKLYSEEIEHIDPGPVEAVTATGANLLQVIRYAVVPQIIPPFLAYTLLRWDINMRAATIVGFVAGGGIGFFVIETIRMGGYREYAAALWSVAIVIIVVDYLSARWRASILEDKPRPTQEARRWRAFRTAVYVVLGLALFIYSWNVTRINLKDLFQPAPTFIRLVRDFITIDLQPATLETVIKQMLITIFQALLATTLGGVFAVPASFLAAKNLTGRSRLSAWIYYAMRSLFNVLRSIEALLYVAIFVFWVGIGPFAGMLALAVTSFALLGKLFSEAIENIELGPMEAITAVGANRLQVIAFAVLPQIVPPFVSYLIYQWDINIRMATIIGFAGGGGIGLVLSSFFGMLQYHKAGTVVLFIVVVVALMDFASAKLREKLV